MSVIFLSFGIYNIFVQFRRNQKGASPDGRNSLSFRAPPTPPPYNEKCIEYTRTCQNGECVHVLKSNYSSCVCYHGWVGIYCDTRVNATSLQPPSYDHLLKGVCTPNPCINDGTCSIHRFRPLGYHCKCPKSLHRRYTWGEHCEKICRGCTDRVCHAEKGCLACDKPGWVGPPDCLHFDCTEKPCENFGYCNKTVVSGRAQMSCKCSVAYTGNRCETPLNTVLDYFVYTCNGRDMWNPCPGGSTCLATDLEWEYVPYTRLVHKYYCICAKGRYGPRCEFWCRSPHTSICDHGDCRTIKKLSKYYNKPPKVQCVCWPGYRGENCNKRCKNSYGLGCKHKCGHCGGNKSCHHAHGLCLANECAPKYVGIRCKKKASLLKNSSSVGHNLAFNIFSADDFNLTNASNTNIILEPFINVLRMFISDSYEMYNKTVLDISNVIIRDRTFEIIAAEGERSDVDAVIPVAKREAEIFVPFGRFSMKFQSLKESLTKRDVSGQTPKEYELNFTVTFAEAVTSNEIMAVLRNEAANFKYPGVSIDRESIKVGKRQMLNVKSSDADKLPAGDDKRLLLIVAAVVAAVAIAVIVVIMLVRIKLLGGRRAAETVTRRRKYAQVQSKGYSTCAS